MHLVQLFLPLRDDAGRGFGRALFDEVRATLAERFGGSTAFVRSPAAGLWEGDDGTLEHDDVVLVEVLVDTLDHGWWRDYRHALERRFRQDAILVRALPAETL
ncbi:MAG TPA: hypothetical protein VLM17_00050 [Xanthomonadaceae bacterium]|nr:hypothetical protein [Xanthomonadaceae bacterium]